MISRVAALSCRLGLTSAAQRSRGRSALPGVSSRQPVLSMSSRSDRRAFSLTRTINTACRAHWQSIVVAGVTALLLASLCPRRSQIAFERKNTGNRQDDRPTEQPVTHPAYLHKDRNSQTQVFVSPGLKDQDAKAASQLQFYETLDVEAQDADLPVEDAILTTAPHVPPPITRDHPVLLRVPLTTSAKLAQLTSQYKYEQWTFNDTVPGPFVRARVGDVVELTLTNRDGTGNPHNIDSHAFTGPGGGAALTTAEESETKTARFRLLHPGLFLYHCAAAPVPVHIANGMYGLMYVQPAHGGLPRVDREYFVLQSEFYHEPPEIGDDGRRSRTVEFSYPGALREEPSAVVFNGSESALTRERPLKAAAGETVRVFFGNAGPNLTSSFHVIGSNFRSVYRDGDVLSPPGRFVSTVSVPPGGATIVDLKMVVPGTYTLLDHAIFRLDKGAVGFLNVSGKPRPDIYGSSQPPAPCIGCKLHP